VTVPDVQQLLSDFIARWERGERPDPADYLERVEGVDRRELAALIDGYLERAPRRRVDPAVLAGSPVRALVDDLARALEGRAGTWPVLLPRLRAAARLRRAELVQRLADALGVGDRAEKVGRYYHAMEQGQLDPRGVSDRVLEALASLTGTTAQALREAAGALAPPRRPPAPDGAAPGVAFARTAAPDPEHLAAMAQGQAGRVEADGDEPDEVDELFTGGVR
jgi:hypothetical protein